jgi:hypothetical protein
MMTLCNYGDRSKNHSWGATVLAGLALLAASGPAFADIYNVNRSFSDGVNSATLTGTVDVSEGSYAIVNGGASPFNSVNLTLTVNGTSYSLSHALTGMIEGTGQFFVDATSATLTFRTATSDGVNPADLVFSDNTSPSVNNRYVIGSNGNPHFEAAYTSNGGFAESTDIPAIFGTVGSPVVPEPTTFLAGALLLLPFGASAIRFLRKNTTA